MRFTVLILALLMAPAVASAELTPEQKEVIENARARMYNRTFDNTEARALQADCLPVALWVNFTTKAAKIELTEDRIRTTAESRLRGARIYRDNYYAYPRLDVDVNIAGLAFSIIVKLRKRVIDDTPALMVRGVEGVLSWADIDARTIEATTWMTGSTGVHSGNAGYIIQNLAESMDNFVNEYLKANAAYC